MPVSSIEFTPVDKEGLNLALFEANLNTWQKFIPGLASRFRQFESTVSQLLSDNNSGFDIHHNGRTLLSMPSHLWAKKCTDDLRNGKNITRIVTEPVGFPGIERDTIKRMEETATAMLSTPLERFPTHVESFHLILFGVGLAEQIPLVAQATNCRNLVLVEPHTEFLYHSLYTFDWSWVFETFRQKKFKLSIIVDNDPEMVFVSIADAVQTFAPHLTDGLTLYRSYDDDLINHLAAETTTRIRDFIAASGFFQDECDMVSNAYRNLHGYSGHTYLRRGAAVPYPAFIVGSGPSLDYAYDAIRKYQNQAIIISCGTTRFPR